MCFTYLSNSSVKVLLDVFVKHIFRCSQFDFIVLLFFSGGCRGPNIFNIIRGPIERQPLIKKSMRGVFNFIFLDH